MGNVILLLSGIALGAVLTFVVLESYWYGVQVQVLKDKMQATKEMAIAKKMKREYSKKLNYKF